MERTYSEIFCLTPISPEIKNLNFDVDRKSITELFRSTGRNQAKAAAAADAAVTAAVAAVTAAAQVDYYLVITFMGC